MQGYTKQSARQATLEHALQMVELAEQALGENLHFFTDLSDLHIRQGDKDAITRLERLNNAWRELVVFLHENKGEV